MHLRVLLMVLAAAALTTSLTCRAAVPQKKSDKVTVDSVLVTLIEQVEVPAREVGVLASMAVKEGQLVEEGAVLAQIDDTEAQLAMTRSRIERDIAAADAKNDVKVRFATKSLEVANAELKRATGSMEKYPKSVSATELDRLRLASDRSTLEVEETTEQLKTARLTAELKENEFRLATRNVERRKIVAPIAGVVVQINSHQGEWVEPGKPVIRILRINRLRAEGFLNGKELGGELTGRKVTLTAGLPGKPKSEFSGTIVFVSPEINPVNGQIRFWAEIDNRDLLLRPGLSASLDIDLATAKSVKP